MLNFLKRIREPKTIETVDDLKKIAPKEVTVIEIDLSKVDLPERADNNETNKNGKT